MSLLEFPTIPVKGFNGLDTLSDPQSLPPDYASISDNWAFTPGGILSRPGMATKFTLGIGTTPVEHAELFFHVGGASLKHYLFLASVAGNMTLFDWYGSTLKTVLTSFPTGTLPAGTTHFTVAQYFGRALICFSNGFQGAGSPYIYDPDWTAPYCVPMALAIETGHSGFGAANSGTAGSVTAGVHSFMVLAETRSGFINMPFQAGSGVDVVATVTAPGSEQAVLSNIPTYNVAGVYPHVTKRHIVMTAAGLAEYFIVATINDNTTTSYTVNVDDTALTDGQSADVYFTYRDALPGAMVNGIYHGRQIMLGDGSNSSTVLVSEVDQVESFVEATGFLLVNREDGQRATNIFLERDTLYLCKERAVWSTEDTGSGPETWPIYLAADGVGAVGPSCISGGQPWRGDQGGQDDSTVWIQDAKGLYKFNGGTAIPYSRHIRPTWIALDVQGMARSEVHADVKNGRVLCLVAESGHSTPNLILAADVTTKVTKWSKWTFTAGLSNLPRSLIVSPAAFTDPAEVLIWDEAGNYVKKFDASSHSDLGTGLATCAIPCQYRTGPVGGNGLLSLFGGLTAYLAGAYDASLKLIGLAGSALWTKSVTLADPAARDVQILTNVRQECVQVDISMNTIGGWVRCERLAIHAQADGYRGL